MTSPPALQQSALEQAGAVVTDTSLWFANPTELSWEQYERLGSFLGTLGSAYCWWVGDFLVYGEEIFGEEFAQIEKSLPHSEHTLQNYASIARRIPPNRRRHGLSFGIHETVAYMEPKIREQLLDEAQEKGWKRAQMRDAKRELSGPVGEPAVTGTASPPGNGDPVPGPKTCPHCGRPYE